MSWLRLTAGLLLLAGTLQCPEVASAQRRPPPEAVEFYQSGRDHYRAGRYREAIADLERALTLDPGSPTLIFNLARVHELLGEVDRALLYYGQYSQLLGQEQSEERARVQETIGRLEGAREEIGRRAPPTPPAQPPDMDEEREPRFVTERGIADTPFWVLAGSSAAVLLGGCIVGLMALDAASESSLFVVRREEDLQTLNDLDVRANTLALAADVMFIIGGAGAIAAGLLFIMRTRTFEVLPENVGPAVAFDAHGGSLLLRGRW